MTRWLQCPAVLMASLIALALCVRSGPRGQTETASPDTLRSERLLLRKSDSSENESALAERGHPDRLAAERRAPDSTSSKAVPTVTSRPTQPLPGTHLSPTSYAYEEGEPTGSRPSSQPTASPEASSQEPRFGAVPKSHAVHRTFVKHRVVNGDDLRSLARRYLNDADHYLEIFHANRDVLTQPDLLPLGAELQIPISRP